MKRVDIDVEFLHQTDDAVLVDTGDDEVWIPKSLILDENELHYVERHDSVTLDIPEWFAIKNDIL